MSKHNFSSPLHRIQVFNLIKTIILRSQKSTGHVNLTLFDGLITEIRFKMNIDYAKYLNGGVKNKAGVVLHQPIGKISKMLNSYLDGTLTLPRSVAKTHSFHLQDFSLINPIKMMEALDPEYLEQEEQEVQIEKKLTRKFTQKVGFVTGTK